MKKSIYNYACVARRERKNDNAVDELGSLQDARWADKTNYASHGPDRPRTHGDQYFSAYGGRLAVFAAAADTTR